MDSLVISVHCFSLQEIASCKAKSTLGRIAGSAPAKRGHSDGGEDAARGSPAQAAYLAKGR